MSPRQPTVDELDDVDDEDAVLDDVGLRGEAAGDESAEAPEAVR